MLKLEISTRGVLLVIGLLAGLWVLTQLWSVILLVFIALILMIGLQPYVDDLVRRGVPRPAAVLAIIFGIVAVLVALVSLMIPPMINEFRDIRDNLPEHGREIDSLLGHIGIELGLEQRARDVDWNSLLSGRAAVDAGQRVLSTTLSVITVIVITAYLLADSQRLGRFFAQFIPRDREEEVNRIMRSLTQVVGGYLRGQLITSLAIGVYTFVVLRIVGVPNPLAFAVLAGFADIIPLIGAFIATIPPVVAALEESSTKAAVVLALLLAYQQFEDRYFAPRVYGRTLNLPPIIVLIAILAGAELLGIVGVLLALPLTAAARVGMDYILEKRMVPLPAEAMAGPVDPREEVFAPNRQDEPPETAKAAAAAVEEAEEEAAKADGATDLAKTTAEGE